MFLAFDPFPQKKTRIRKITVRYENDPDSRPRSLAYLFWLKEMLYDPVVGSCWAGKLSELSPKFPRMLLPKSLSLPMVSVLRWGCAWAGTLLPRVSGRHATFRDLSLKKFTISVQQPPDQQTHNELF